MMGKVSTWIVAGLVAAGFGGLGVGIDRRVRSHPFATLVGATAGLAFLIGTFVPRARMFGASIAAKELPGTFALTFDDGPDPRHTVEISRLLAERGHRATFFVLARAVDEHPAVVARVVADGHEIASHGADHRLLAFARPGVLREQLTATEDAVQRATGSPPVRLFRPPHGVRSAWLTRVVERRGYRVCAWHGRVFDTSEPGAEVIVHRVERVLHPGAIVLLHDGDGSGRGGSRAQTVEALPTILDRAESCGLRSVRLSSLLR